MGVCTCARRTPPPPERARALRVRDSYADLLLAHVCVCPRRIARRRDLEAGPVVVGADCVICMSEVDPAARNVLVTPCDHLFHAECLTRWMEVKLECPTCRAALPLM